MKYRYCCVNAPDLEELNYIVDNSKYITVNTFKKAIGSENYNELKESLGYTKQLKKDCNLTLENDWSVTFHKSKLEDNTPVYFCCHSAIEHIYY